MSILSQLYLDHHQQSSLLDCLKYCLENNSDEVMLAMDISAIMPLALHYLSSYSEQWHHPIEEAACHLLLKKALSNREKELIFLNKSEHSTLESLSKNLLNCYQNQTDQQNIDSVLKKNFLTFIDLQNKHTNYENKSIYPLLDRYLQDEDWKSVKEIYKKCEQNKSQEGITQKYQDLFKFIIKVERKIRGGNLIAADYRSFQKANLPHNRGINNDAFKKNSRFHRKSI